MRNHIPVLVLVAAVGGCNQRREAAPQSGGQVAVAPVSGGGSATDLLIGEAMAAPAGGATGTIKGTVKLNGTPPPAKDLNMKSDPFCAKQKGGKDEEVVVSNGQLKNVVVRVAKGLSGTFPPPAADAVLDQQGCIYRPRVLVAQAGQSVAIKNSDQTLHNVHTYKGTATLFNQAQVFGTPPIKKKFPSVGDVVKFKCDVHPWMTGWVVVTDNPFFAVSADDGSFTINNVPAGSYTVEAWHERFGTKQAQVTVAPGKPAELALEFAAK
jgi:plastocyanin